MLWLSLQRCTTRMARILDVYQVCDGTEPETKLREWALFFTQGSTRDDKLVFLFELYGSSFLALVCYAICIAGADLQYHVSVLILAQLAQIKKQQVLCCKHVMHDKRMTRL